LTLSSTGAYSVAARARSSVPAVVPTYISLVIRLLAWPAIWATSVSLTFQVNSAVTQKTCRRLCQVHSPFPASSRQPAAL